MRWAKFLIKIPNNWMTWLLHDYNIRIKVFNCMPYEHEGGRGLIKLSSNENIDAIFDLIRNRSEYLTFPGAPVLLKGRMKSFNLHIVMGIMNIQGECTSAIFLLYLKSLLQQCQKS